MRHIFSLFVLLWGNADLLLPETLRPAPSDIGSRPTTENELHTKIYAMQEQLRVRTELVIYKTQEVFWQRQQENIDTEKGNEGQCGPAKSDLGEESKIVQLQEQLRFMEEVVSYKIQEHIQAKKDCRDVSCLLLDEPGIVPNFKVARDDFMRRLEAQLKEQTRRLRVVQIPPSGELPVEGAKPNKSQVLIMPCLAISRVSSSIDSLMSKPAAKVGHTLLFVVFHPRAPHDRTVASTVQQIGSLPPSCEKLVDIVFNRSNGEIFNGAPVEAAVSSVADYMMMRPAEQTLQSATQ